MTKISILYKGHRRTFYTRKDWKQGKKLYLYYYKAVKCTGNWYTDPNYQEGICWQDYEREYARQQREGLTVPISDEVKEMKQIVEEHNDAILRLAEQGIKTLDLEDFLNKPQEDDNMLGVWLEEQAKEIEKMTDQKIQFKVGTCQCKTYLGDDKYEQIKGDLFITTHNGNYFMVIDHEKEITDVFDVFSNDDIINIDEENFKYITPNFDDGVFAISINQIQRDIDTLHNEFLKYSGVWEWEDGGFSCVSIAEEELALVKGIAKRYPFEYKYNPSDFEQDFTLEDISQIAFDIDDFEQNIVNENNYTTVDSVAFDFKEELVMMLTQLKNELEWLPPRFREEFIVDVICQCPQDRHSVRKNCEYFADTIGSELTEEEKSSMYIVLK